MRVVLVDHHHLLRAGVRRLLDAIPEVEVLAEAGSLQSLLHSAGVHRADVAVLNPLLPDAPACGAVAELKRQLPRATLLVLSPSPDAEAVRRALADGALAYITYESSPADLELALRAASGNHVYISPLVSHRLVERRTLRRPQRTRVFSRRQREVLRLIGLGKSTREIAAAMGISVKTVETHRARLMESLQLSGSAELMRYALTVGFK